MPKKRDKVKDYKYRNKEKMLNVLNKGFWKESELDVVLHMLLYSECESLNQIVPYLHGKTLNDIIALVADDLGLRGTTHVCVESQCAACGKKMLVNVARYRKGNIYCCMECRDRGYVINKSHAGTNNGRYNSSVEHCAQCGADILVPKYRQDQTNMFGDHHVFCSHECYWKYRRTYYVGEKCPATGMVVSQEQRDAFRDRMMQLMHDGRLPQTLTRPHEIANQLLTEIGISDAENEKRCGYYSIDIYLPSSGLCIEVMGDYWHASPIKYEYNELSDRQRNDVRRDKSKHTYIKKYYNTEILYLWEYDLIRRPDVCKHLIEKYIDSHGNIDNYQSFNYELRNNELILRNPIINPYFITKNA